MSNESGGIGGCFGAILVIMVVLAAFGFIEWSTVGSLVRTLVYIAIIGVVIIIAIVLYYKMK